MQVFVGIPSGGHPHPLFTECLANMIARTMAEGVVVPGGKRARPGIRTKVEIAKLPMSRNRLLKHAIASGASHMLWLDDDHIFPDTSLIRLAQADVDIVGVNYATRFAPYAPTARRVDGERIYTDEAMAQKGLVERVGGIGFGMVLMRMSIVEKLRAKAEAEGRSLFPLFEFQQTEDPAVTGGEDGHFCGRCAEAGIPIHVDHLLSWSIGHVAEIAVGMRESLGHRPAT